MIKCIEKFGLDETAKTVRAKLDAALENADMRVSVCLDVENSNEFASLTEVSSEKRVNELLGLLYKATQLDGLNALVTIDVNTDFRDDDAPRYRYLMMVEAYN